MLLKFLFLFDQSNARNVFQVLNNSIRMSTIDIERLTCLLIDIGLKKGQTNKMGDYDKNKGCMRK